MVGGVTVFRKSFACDRTWTREDVGNESLSMVDTSAAIWRGFCRLVRETFSDDEVEVDN